MLTRGNVRQRSANATTLAIQDDLRKSSRRSLIFKTYLISVKKFEFATPKI